MQVFQGTPEQLKKASKSYEALLDSYVEKKGGDATRTEIKIENNLMYIAIIRTAVGDHLKVVKDNKEKIKKLKD